MSAAGQPNAIADLRSIQVGEERRFSKKITAEDVRAFAELTGDHNPLHMDADFASSTSFQRRVVHGMLVASYVSTMVGMHLPGPGALWTQQNFQWAAPVFIGDQLDFLLRVTQRSEATRTVKIEVKVMNQSGKTVMAGEGSVMLLESKSRLRDAALSERVALVSGASRGIGAATARALAKQGAAVAVNYRQSAVEAEELCHLIAGDGGRAIAVQANVADAEAVEKAIQTARCEFGKPVDVLVNNAGAAFTPRTLLEASWQEIEDQLTVDVRGAFNCCKAVLPGMLERSSGRIVNVGSSLTWGRPPVEWGPFVIAKSALKALTLSLAAELGPRGLRVNMISPGMTETEFISTTSERLRKVEAMQTPLRQLGTAEDVANTIVFLCSEAGAHLTGVDIPVCGGSRM